MKCLTRFAIDVFRWKILRVTSPSLLGIGVDSTKLSLKEIWQRS